MKLKARQTFLTPLSIYSKLKNQRRTAPLVLFFSLSAFKNIEEPAYQAFSNLAANGGQRAVSSFFKRGFLVSGRGLSGWLFFFLCRGGFLGWGLSLLLEVLIGRFAVNGVLIFGVKGTLLDQAAPGIGGGGTHVALRREDKAALDHGGASLFIQAGYQGFASA